ncbi:DUF1492 domain-containing protein [Streptococcus vestibularis]|uniref:DUF1492 domain-containing protein n=1 Tax=Streptococcus vestibularis TaxID=1343 RepID=UPI001D0BCB52|nr:DUF1492 domain-containing protein [Streptococcus vestibularis]MCB8556849.1 DUF1492 domain-containing protein [Streptococcus vestibularis]MCB8587639.1 DUF1492 domain-containing protein [Streptococcus vestibularis]
MKTSQRLKELKALDRYIDSQLERIQKLEASATKVTAALPQADKISGGMKRKQDDIYVELIDEEEEVRKLCKQAIQKRREFYNLIYQVDDYQARDMLTMVYIDKLSIWQIMDRLEISKATYYVLLRRAERKLDV